MNADVIKEIEDLRRRLEALERRVERGERDGEARARRTIDEFKAEVKSISTSVESHIDGALKAAIAPYLEKLSHVESVTALSTRLPEIIALLERTERELVERRTRADLEAEAKKEAARQEEKAKAEKAQQEEIAAAKAEAARVHRRAVLTVLGTIAVALIGTCGAAVASQIRGPVVEPKK